MSMLGHLVGGDTHTCTYRRCVGSAKLKCSHFIKFAMTLMETISQPLSHAIHQFASASYGFRFGDGGGGGGLCVKSATNRSVFLRRKWGECEVADFCEP